MRNLKISIIATAIISILLTTALFPTSPSQAAESALDTGAIERLTAPRVRSTKRKVCSRYLFPAKTSRWSSRA